MKLSKLNGGIVNIIPKSKIDWEKKVSIPQLVVKQFLFPFWKDDIVAEEFVIPGSKLRIDLLNFTKKVAIEVNPDSYHVQYNNWLHKSRVAFSQKVRNDENKRIWCEKNGIELIELYDTEIEDIENFFASRYI
jgi:hypothetical protein